MSFVSHGRCLVAKNYEKPDFWSLKAQKEGYPARSVYKFKEMDEKFSLLKPRVRMLDLGAAPGSWSLYALRKLKGGSFLAAVDLAPLSRVYDNGLFDGENFFFIQGDMTSPDIKEKLLARGPYGLVICDAAPATTGNRSIDTIRSLDLAETALAIAEAALTKGGNLVVKVFQGGDSASFLKQIRAGFESGKSFKPQACRSESFETYYLGLGKK
ncbi:MAG: RlmE family RNA methyltransferase [Treponema sp.]|jgi:23S rRNA (uridine2552-2'-O)-methyltransferase|nr:RlmE family RNA methyltransferase [Treponema sp.]